MISQPTFQKLAAEGYTHIPLIQKRLLDTDTPVSVFARLRDLNAAAYLFESVQGGERWGRYSIIGLGSDVLLQYSKGKMVESVQGVLTEHACDDPFEYLRQYKSRFVMPTEDVIHDLPSFSGGFVGYFGYDMVRYVEPVLGDGKASDPMNLPDMWLMLSKTLVVFDNLQHTLSIIVYADTQTETGYAAALKMLQLVERKLAETPTLTASMLPTPHFSSVTGEDKYCSDVDKIKDYIKAGDVMQVVPAQRMSADYKGDALSVYRALRHLNPSPYMFLVHGFTLQDNNGFDLVGSSPEILSRVEEGVVTVRPLAGTRKRGDTPAEDDALERELLADQKEIAEHLMLIDLGRNDVGRVAQTGKVRVTKKMFVERYSHVMHIASNVEADLLPDVDALDVFQATFPAGTLSGAPKIRAMQIIDELEPVRRTVFGGAIGYLGWHDNMDTAIAIRTAVLRDGKAHVQAGAGVVADSVPASEWDETIKKASAVIKAVEMAANGLKLSS